MGDPPSVKPSFRQLFQQLVHAINASCFKPGPNRQLYPLTYPSFGGWGPITMADELWEKAISLMDFKRGGI